MNKQDLKAKWSKYCNTDKLVDDAIILLRKHRHNCTEHGVCTLFDTYFTNKEPLIKLFATSKHYIGDMRIAIEKEFERSIVPSEVRSFFYDIERRFYAYEMLKFQDADGKTFFDHFATGKRVLGIDDLPSKKQQTNFRANIKKFNFENMATAESDAMLKEFMDYMHRFSQITTSTLTRDYKAHARHKTETPSIKKGTKTSRAFNAVCTHYGVDKLHPETTTVVLNNGSTTTRTTYPYDKLFAKYADLVSDLSRKMQFIISLNPLDYLTMSNGVNWHSCHRINGGQYMGGTLSYMLDSTSIITFVVDKIQGDIHEIPKVYRQMYHYENNLFIQNRLYPQSNDGAVNLYDRFRDFMIEEFASLLNVNGEWTCKSEYGVGREYAVNAPDSKHYPDHYYNESVTAFYPESKASSALSTVMTIGHTGICVNCGNEYSVSYRLSHSNASECRQ